MPKSAVAPSRLLVVLADERLRMELRRRFTRCGYEVMAAENAAKALSLVAMIPFDLVLLDIDLPAPGGLDLLRRMRENRNPAELPVIVLTGEGAPEDAAEALAAGANDALSKPVDIEVAYLRAGMHARRRRGAPAGRAVHADIQARLATLQQAVVHAENTAALMVEVGHDVRAPLVGVLRAAEVLTRVCLTAEMKAPVATIETARATLDGLLVAALGTGERRNRTPPESLRVLSADDDAESRHAVREMLHVTETPVELVDVSTGLQAALAAEARTFDLILINVAAAESMAGIRAIRRAERQNKVRRVPILALGGDGPAAARAMVAGADMHMAAPVTGERLLAALAGEMSRGSAELTAVA